MTCQTALHVPRSQDAYEKGLTQDAETEQDFWNGIFFFTVLVIPFKKKYTDYTPAYLGGTIGSVT